MVLWPIIDVSLSYRSHSSNMGGTGSGGAKGGGDDGSFSFFFLCYDINGYEVLFATFGK